VRALLPEPQGGTAAGVVGERITRPGRIRGMRRTPCLSWVKSGGDDRAMQRPMSACPRKRTSSRSSRYVRLVPQAAVSNRSKARHLGSRSSARAK
jgi:hypothetical protein